MIEKAVVVGAGRPLGTELTSRLARRGDKVRAVVVDEGRGRTLFPEGVDVLGVSPNAESVEKACDQATIIYNCYEPQRAGTSAAAEFNSKMLLAAIRQGAKFVLVSYLFNSLRDNHAVEDDCLGAHRSLLAKAMVARVPQLYGPRVENALFREVFESVIAGRKAHWLGALDVPRSYVYVGDAADALLQLAGDDFAFGRAWNVAGPGPLTGRQFIEMAFEAANGEKNIGHWGRGLMLTARVLNSRARDLLGLPYDYYSPFVLKGDDFTSRFPAFAYTAPQSAIAETLRWYQDRAIATSGAVDGPA